MEIFEPGSASSCFERSGDSIMEESTPVGPSPDQPTSSSNVTVTSPEALNLHEPDIDDPKFFEKINKAIGQMSGNMKKWDYNTTVVVHNENGELESIFRPSFISAINALARIVHGDRPDFFLNNTVE